MIVYALPALGVLALLVTQAVSTRDEIAGASIVLDQAANNFALLTVTQPAANRACLSPPSNTIPVGAVTVRVGIVILSQAGQRAVFGNGDGDIYAAMEIQAAPSTQPIRRPPDAIDMLQDTEVQTFATPIFPTDGLGHVCQISVVRQGFANMPWRCACAQTPATCTWTGGASVKDQTFAPGTWSGAGCLAKPCVQRFGTESMPISCQP